MGAGVNDGPRVVRVAGDDPDLALAQLGLTPGVPVLVVVGGASELDRTGKEGLNSEEEKKREQWRDNILTIFELAVRPTLRAKHVVVLTGGTDAGVMRIAGQSLAQHAASLIGVVPAAMALGSAAQATLQPDHHAVVVTQGSQWGAETEMLYRLAEALTADSAPGLLLLANGGGVARKETQQFLRGGWPVAVLADTGGSADELVSTLMQGKRTEWGEVRASDIEVLPSDPDQARRQLDWRLDADDLLKAAWVRYSAFDEAGNRLKATAVRTRRVVAGSTLALLALVISLVQFAVLRWTSPDGTKLDQLRSEPVRAVLPFLNGAIVALPVAIAVAVALGSFLSSDQKWRSVRAAAETLKREIYRYRANASDSYLGRTRLEAVLRAVDEEALRGGASLAAQRLSLIRERPPAVDPDELAVLTARSYLKHRVDGQLSYFRESAQKYQRSEFRFVLGTSLAAASATVLAGTQFAVWIAFLVLVASAFSVYRQRQRLRELVGGFDRAVADVEAARVNWIRRRHEQGPDQDALLTLVADVESALERENLSWEDTVRRAIEEAERYRSAVVDGAG